MIVGFDFTSWYGLAFLIAAAYLFWAGVLDTGHRHYRAIKRWIRPELPEPPIVRLGSPFEKGLARSSDFVCCTAVGKPLYYRNALRDLGTAAERAGLNDGDEPNVSTHDLRHTAISRWIAAGLDEATVARMAGDTVEVIHSTYLHEFERARRAD